MNIVITGASKGIGYETAKLLGASAENTVIAISRDQAKLDDLASIGGAGTIIPIGFDLAMGRDSFENDLKKQILEHIDTVDILINNAGYLVNKPFEEIADEDMEEVFNVNLFGIIRISQLLIPYMGRATRAHIINIGSMGGYPGSAKFSGLSVYSASKGAVATLSECMALEFRDKNIAVNCLALGAVQTEMLTKAFPGFEAPVKASDMAKYVAEFALKGMHEFNGQVIPVELG